MISSIVALVSLAVPKAIFYGDTRSVSAIVKSPSGNLVVATRGGLITYADGRPISHGWDGLIEGRGLDDVWVSGKKVFASSGGVVALWDGAKFIVDPSLHPRAVEEVTATNVPERPAWPASLSGDFAPAAGNMGTHVTAVAASPTHLFAAWFGDGIWARSNAAWRPFPHPAGEQFRRVKSMWAAQDDLAVATTEGAVWEFHAGKWTHLPTVPGPHGSIYGLSQLRGKTYAGSFENGVIAQAGHGWKNLGSSQNPREMVIFGGSLYARTSTNKVDRFDGNTWSRDVFPWLPRVEVTCLGAGDGKILAGQFGGWSEYDGKTWKHHLKIPQLQGFVVTALAAKSGEVWIGTQGLGIGRFDRKSGAFTLYDQRQGLGDDWVRHIDLANGNVLVGLFRSGAFTMVGDSFVRLIPELNGEATGFAVSPSRIPFVGSRDGLWRLSPTGPQRVPVGGVEKLEIQAVYSDAKGIWLGLPNGIAFVPWQSVG